MNVIESLTSGCFGIRFQPSEHFDFCSENRRSAQFFDESTQVIWYFYLFPDLYFNLAEEHRPNLEQSLGWYARDIFETFHRSQHLDDAHEPRTVDPGWSPLIDVEYLSIQGSQILRTLHRMAYEPGLEIIMGHILIPLQQGLFEVRIVTQDSTTGYRESLLMADLLNEQHPCDEQEIRQIVSTVKQQDMDSLQNDERFPQHCLSRARAAQNWFCHQAEFEITEPTSPWTSGEFRLPSLSCTLIPPPRFIYKRALTTYTQECFERVSFCATDGVEQLLVYQWGRPPGKLNFLYTAESMARTISEAANIQELKVTVSELPPYKEKPQVLAVIEGIGHIGTLRNVMWFFLDEAQRIWTLTWVATNAVPVEAVLVELEATMKSFRFTYESTPFPSKQSSLPQAPPLPPRVKKKPWWQFW